VPRSPQATVGLAELAPSEIRFIPVLPPLALGLDQRTADALHQLAHEHDVPELRIVADLFAIALERSRSQVDLRLRWETLSYREQQIALLLKDGHRSRQIAGDLAISIETVRSHLKSIYRKLDLASAAELRRALRTEEVFHELLAHHQARAQRQD
jgi:DNA-binding CsgD family transcriptional regulator